MVLCDDSFSAVSISSRSSWMMFVAFSAIMMLGALLLLAERSVGIMDESTTRSLPMPRTLSNRKWKEEKNRPDKIVTIYACYDQKI